MHLDNIEKDSSLVIFDWNAIMNQTQPDPLRVLNSVYAFVKQLHCELYIILGPEDVAQKMGFQLQCETRMESIPLMDAFAQIEATPETMIVLGKQRDFSRVYELLSPKGFNVAYVLLDTDDLTSFPAVSNWIIYPKYFLNLLNAWPWWRIEPFRPGITPIPDKTQTSLKDQCITSDGFGREYESLNCFAYEIKAKTHESGVVLWLFKHSLDLNPDQPQILKEIIVILVQQQGQIPKAPPVSMLQQRIAYNRSTIAIYEESLKYYSMACKLDPTNIVIVKAMTNLLRLVDLMRQEQLSLTKLEKIQSERWKPCAAVIIFFVICLILFGILGSLSHS